jgi:hypothetical protein
MLWRTGRRAVAMLVCLAAGAAADLDVGLTMEHQQYIQFEPIVGYITIHNDSFEPVVIDAAGSNAANTEITIEVTHGGKTSTRINDKPLIRHAVVMPSEEFVTMLDLSQWFEMADMGRYFIQATIMRGLEQAVSATRMIDVVRGLELAQVERGVPGYPGRLRTYSLRYWMRDRKEILFLSVDEAESGMNYGVFALGPIMRVDRPRLEVDRNGIVRVYHRTAQNKLARTVFESTPENVRFLEQRNVSQ